jgi:hypothetical protein
VSKIVNAIKAVEIDKCFSLLYKLQRGLSGLLWWSRRKLWGTVRRVCNAALLRLNERLMKKNRKTNERWTFEPVENCKGVEGEKAREWWWIITSSQQGQCKFGDGWPADLASNATSLRALSPSALFLALVLSHAVIVFKTRYTRLQDHADLRAYSNVTLSSALVAEKGFNQQNLACFLSTYSIAFTLQSRLRSIANRIPGRNSNSLPSAAPFVFSFNASSLDLKCLTLVRTFLLPRLLQNISIVFLGGSNTYLTA